MELNSYITIFSTAKYQNVPCNNGAKTIFFGSTATHNYFSLSTVTERYQKKKIYWCIHTTFYYFTFLQALSLWTCRQQWRTQVYMFFYLLLFCFSSFISLSPKLWKTQIWNLSLHSKPLQIKQTSLQLGTPPPSLSVHSHCFLATRLAGKRRERSEKWEWRVERHDTEIERKKEINKIM